MTKDQVETFIGSIDEIPEDEFMVEIEEDELTREECDVLIASMDEFEKKQKEKLREQVKVYSYKDYSQEFLRSLIPKR